MIRSFLALIGPVLLTAFAVPVFSQIEPGDSEERIIGYNTSEGLTDPIALLQKRLNDGHAGLKFEPRHGYLGSLLKALRVPVSSQGLVFSKTSSQADQTTPRTPRAIYFADDVYVGWVPGGRVIDLAAVDPMRGPIFYTLEQRSDGPPRFSRRADCMQCHLGPKTLNVPGLIVRSVLTRSDGTALSEVPGFVNGHNSPLEERWGGWYVTGTHAGASHLGNDFTMNSERHGGSGADFQGSGDGGNVTDLRGRFEAKRYLSRHSDLVALMVLEHQLRMQNLITRANYETRLAFDQDATHTSGLTKFTKSKEQAGISSVSSAETSDWPQQRIAIAGEMLLEYMLLRNETALKGPVNGTSTFAKEFPRNGPCDSRGRSLRQFDLKNRLFRYPCSFLIYSAGFDALPPRMKNYLWRRLNEILSGKDQSETYVTMRAEDRQAVLEILRDTKPEFKEWLTVNAQANVAGAASR